MSGAARALELSARLVRHEAAVILAGLPREAAGAVLERRADLLEEVHGPSRATRATRARAHRTMRANEAHTINRRAAR